MWGHSYSVDLSYSYGSMKKHLLIIFHSQKGHNEQLAKACLGGAELEPDVEIRFQKALDTKLEDVLWSDGIIIVTPEYFGNMSGAVKDFFDRTYYPAREQEINLPYALAICCENDGTGAERNIQTIATGYVLRKTLDTLIVKEKELDSELYKAEELGQTFAAGLALGIF